MSNATVRGFISRDAELKQSNGGTSLANFGVGLKCYAKEGENDVTWLNATVFGKQADGLAQYLKKGTFVVLNGDLKLRTFDSERDGGPRTVLEMSVNNITLGGKSGASSGSAQSANAEPRQAKKSVAGGYRAPVDVGEEDIPF